MSGAPAVSARDVWFAYDRKPVLEDVSFQVAQASFTALIGPNGAGKNTLLRILLGLHRPGRGEVSIFGSRPAEERAHPIGYVPQRVRLPAAFPLSVAEVTLMGSVRSARSLPPAGRSRSQASHGRAAAGGHGRPGAPPL